MSPHLRFHAVTQTQNIGVMTAILSLVFAVGHIFPENILVSTYYGVVPFMVIMLSLITASATTTSQLTIAISMGDNRRDYFWSLQPLPLVYTLYGVGVTLLFQNFAPANQGINLFSNLDVLWIALITYVAFFVGTAMGILTTKHPFWGVAIIAILCGGVGAWTGYHSVGFSGAPVTSPSPVAVAAAAVAVLLWNMYLKRYIRRFSI